MSTKKKMAAMTARSTTKKKAMLLLSVVLTLTTMMTMTMTADAKKCQTISRGKKLKDLVSKANVLVALQERQPGSSSSSSSSDDADSADADAAKTKGDKTFQELCDRLESTPSHNTQDLEVVLVTDSSLKKKVWETSTTLYLTPTKSTYFQQFMYKTGLSKLLFKESLPTHDDAAVVGPPVPAYVLYEQGDEPLTGRGFRMKEPLVEYVDDIVMKNRPPSPSDQEEEEEDDATKLSKANADLVSDFLATQLNRKKLGNYVYSLGAYDIMAYDISESILKMDGQPTLPPVIWVKVIAPTLYYVLYPSAAPYEQDIAQEYIKIGNKSLNDKTYVPSQITRLESMLNDSSENKMSSKQHEKLSQRLHILRRFQDPSTAYTKSIVRGFLFRLVLNVLTLVSVVVMLPYLFFFGGEEYVEVAEDEDDKDDEDYDENDHTEEDVPLDDDVVVDGEDDKSEIDPKNILDGTKKRTINA
eukprot:CAMPEP_0113463266 /NCGR_PEP_ID=MMETSP0014_2-20120614/12550_1 /TAXON_ID=2857 /ORGANISM="Nitzschia sp." /LENGTH=470 /DNA_ID=CAMNT_0000355217 /DNA_START=168 /DNA_END=1580 /DNA_ORIENTATION=+ /assembly_acc=CAM_ASM_000159